MGNEFAAQVLQLVFIGISLGCIYALVAVGFSVIFNATGIINFAQGEFLMLGGVLAYVFYTVVQWPLFVAIIIAVLVTTLIGVLVQKLIIDPAWRRQPPLYTFLMITFGVSILLSNAVMLSFGRQPLMLPNFTGDNPIVILGASIVPQTLWTIGLTIVMVVGLNLFFNRTITGKAMKACAINRTAANLMGIPVDRMVLYSFAISAAIGAMAGIVIAPIKFSAFDVGLPFGLKGFLATVIGGFGNIYGAIIGGLILGLLDSLIAGLVSSAYRDAIVFLLLVLVLFLRPEGMLGSLVEKEEI